MAIAFKFGFFGFRASAGFGVLDSEQVQFWGFWIQSKCSFGGLDSEQVQVLGVWIQSKCGNILLLALAKQHHPDSEQERQYRIRAKRFLHQVPKMGKRRQPQPQRCHIEHVWIGLEKADERSRGSGSITRHSYQAKKCQWKRVSGVLVQAEAAS